jgi:hypothetical protein
VQYSTVRRGLTAALSYHNPKAPPLCPAGRRTALTPGIAWLFIQRDAARPFYQVFRRSILSPARRLWGRLLSEPPADVGRVPMSSSVHFSHMLRDTKCRRFVGAISGIETEHSQKKPRRGATKSTKQRLVPLNLPLPNILSAPPDLLGRLEPMRFDQAIADVRAFSWRRRWAAPARNFP